MINSEFKIAISHHSKWDRGYTKVIDYGYMSSVEKGIVGYYQQRANQTGKTSDNTIDKKCPYLEVNLTPAQVEPILNLLSNTSCRLTGPKEKTQFTSVMSSLSVLINHHSTSVSWHAENCAYDEPFEDIWQKVDSLIPPTSEEYYEEKWGKNE